MSNYTIAVAWSGKDALADSDANKVISGADFNTEFTAVQTAVNTKADLNGSASEAFSATTASVGTNTTQVATTAFVRAEILNTIYPVGSIFTTVTAYANSAAVVAAIGGTTWVSFGAGKVLVGVDTGDSDFDTVEETGGAKTDSHTLTISEMPSHNHSLSPSLNSGSSTDGNPNIVSGGNSGSAVSISSTGGGNAHTHDIVQPYITVYMWKRTA
jgi:hypothetical protein